MNSVIREVLEAKFPFVKRGGYDTGKVDEFLDDVEQYLRGLETERDAARAEVNLLRSEVESLRKMEHAVASALVTAQKTADDLRNQAQAESESILEESRKQADEIMEEARKQSEEMLQESRADVRQLEVIVQTLQRRRQDLTRELSEMLNRYQALLEEDKNAETEMEKTLSFRVEDLGGTPHDDTPPPGLGEEEEEG